MADDEVATPTTTATTAIIKDGRNTHSVIISTTPAPPPPCLRWLILFLSSWILFGSFYAFDNPSALNCALRNILAPGHDGSLFQWRFGLLYSVYSVPNIFLPLIVGRGLDRRQQVRSRSQTFQGIRHSRTLLTGLVGLAALVTIGQLLVALGISWASFGWILAGRIIFGLGGESLAVAQTRLITEWFGNSPNNTITTTSTADTESTNERELALAIGVNLSVARIGTVTNNVLSPMIAEASSVQAAFWWGFAACLMSLICTIATVILHYRYAPPPSSSSFLLSGRELAHNHLKGIEQSSIPLMKHSLVSSSSSITVGRSSGHVDPQKLLAAVITSSNNRPTERTFTGLDSKSSALVGRSTEAPSSERSTEVDGSIGKSFWMLAGCMVPYNNVASDYLQTRYYQESILMANTAMSIPDTVALLLTPFLGVYVDRMGRKLTLLAASALCLVFGHTVLAIGRQTSILAIPALLVLGLGYSGLLALWACVPALVSPRRQATAYGILAGACNLSVTLVALIVAPLVAHDPSYRITGLFFAGLGISALLLILLLAVVDGNRGLGLNNQYGNRIHNRHSSGLDVELII